MIKTLIMAFDIGTTGVKTCLFEVDKTVNLIGAAMEGYSLHTKPDGSAEQIPSEWWSAICSTSKKVIEKTGVDPKEIAGISFCSQMQGLVIVDEKGEPIRNAFSYMDQRAKQELKENMA
ncbi:MAG: carbohydrate kinase, partial [Clostridia bacterium]|nr:carbohydrate kinase [Clostridia bacterium]